MGSGGSTALETRGDKRSYCIGSVMFDVRAKIINPIAAINSNNPTNFSDGEYLCINNSILLAFQLYQDNIILGSAKTPVY